MTKKIKGTSKIAKIKAKGSKKYRANVETVKAALNGREMVEMSEALEILGKLQQPNFKDGTTVELHVKLNVDTTKSDQIVRGSVALPNGTGKKVIVAAFVSAENVEKAKKAGADIVGSEELIDEIKKSGKINFDAAIAQTAMMKNLAGVARLLGTAGVMPSPKNQTVGEDIEAMIKSIKAGKVDFKTDKTGNLHIICGKINKDFTTAQLVENVTAAMDAVQKAKPDAIKKKYMASAFLATSQSPSIKVA